MLVVIGVVGEWRCGAKLEDAHNAVHAYDLGKIAAIEKEAAQLQKDAESERLARIKLEASLEWRKFTPEQERKLCSQLGPKLARKYHVNAFVDDLETEAYATSIADALDRCEISGGIKPSSNPPHLGYVARWRPHDRPLFGIWITYDPSPTPVPLPPPSPSGFGTVRGKAEAIALRHKLESSGIKVSGITSDAQGILPLGIIYVGPRFPPNAALIKQPAAAQGGMMP
ncbi:MAG TPA: hypothetical protein VEF05_07770 [Terriglobales bacterium]|nr:hypothetical protein [Terriglobales bacterium]